MSQIIGHRGASKERPENTMAAFVRAHELGACGIEIDVHAILGDAVIIHHDGKLGRCVSAPESSIYTYDAKTIKKYSAGEYFSPLYKNERIPLLCELLEYLQGNDMYLNVEVKNDSGFLSEVGELTVNLLERYNMLGRCIISSFDHGILKSIKNKHPKYKVGILYSSSHCINVVEYCKKYGFDAVHPYYKTVDKEFIRRCHDNNIAVNVWTVNKPQDIALLNDWGVDSIITDDIAAAYKVIR